MSSGPQLSRLIVGMSSRAASHKRRSTAARALHRAAPRTFIGVAACAILGFASCSNRQTWTDAEKALVCRDGNMRVLTIADSADSLLLRQPSIDFSAADIASSTYRELAVMMVATVTDPSQDGVGIAGPQVGILRRIVAVQRFDKEGEPFEVYPNIRITAHYGEKKPGPEGCLSVPDRRGDVMRWQKIDIAYTSPTTLRDTTETVEGFTAVIFQHETDHLDGILYIDRTE